MKINDKAPEFTLANEEGRISAIVNGVKPEEHAGAVLAAMKSKMKRSEAASSPGHAIRECQAGL